MKTNKHYEIDLKRFHELMLEAESQGLTALFTDTDVCNVLFDMWPEDADELGDGAPLTLFDTNYSDKTGPSDDNQLIDLGTVDEPLVDSISVLETDRRIVSVSIDKGPGLGKAYITFVDTKPVGIKITPNEPGGKNASNGIGYTFHCPVCGKETHLEEVVSNILEIYPVKVLGMLPGENEEMETTVDVYGTPYTLEDGDKPQYTKLRCASCDHEFDDETLDSMRDKGWLHICEDTSKQTQ